MWWCWRCLLLTALQYEKNNQSLNVRGLSLSSVSLLNGLSAVQSHWSCQDSVSTHHCQGSRLVPLSELWSFLMSISMHIWYASYDMPATPSTCAWKCCVRPALKINYAVHYFIRQPEKLLRSLPTGFSAMFLWLQVHKYKYSGTPAMSNSRIRTTFSYLFVSYMLTVLVIKYENSFNNALPTLEVWASLSWSQPHIRLT